MSSFLPAFLFTCPKTCVEYMTILIKPLHYFNKSQQLTPIDIRNPLIQIGRNTKNRKAESIQREMQQKSCDKICCYLCKRFVCFLGSPLVLPCDKWARERCRWRGTEVATKKQATTGFAPTVHFTFSCIKLRCEFLLFPCAIFGKWVDRTK
jgi:hypothetical protein